ncbi:MAG TPA: glycoside hydrolase family 30 beta sandwich domain-containing protein [Puia sp.]|nr:glycoside hydrolase family 30 beta sandwich domain-containing protein [Puia sp.]
MKLTIQYFFVITGWLVFAVCTGGCSKKQATGVIPPPSNPVVPTDPVPTDVVFWLTRADGLALFQKQNTSLLFTGTANSNQSITVDSTQRYQTIDGFGCALTGGSAYLIGKLPEAAKDALLRELFATDSSFIGISYLRVSMGASDLSARVFSYDDIPAGQSDTGMANFSLADDLTDLVPLLKKIFVLNPHIKILGSPWSAPIWMKTNNNSIGGSLKPELYGAYAQYFVKYIQTMKSLGIRIDAITTQNEPLNPYNNPSMVMQAPEQAEFIKNHLGPAFEAAGIDTKIILNENNPDIPDYPISILDDPDARKYTDGSAFHLYGGDISGLSVVHNAYPDKNIYFTEQWVGAPGDFSAYLNSHVKYLIVGATRNWSKNVLEWNLASDPSYNPHTPGGCNTCLGALTIGNTITRNVGYYIMAHAAKFVLPGSVRIASTMSATLPNVAFKTPSGKKVLIVLNDSPLTQTFTINYNDRFVSPVLAAGAVGTFIW